MSKDLLLHVIFKAWKPCASCNVLVFKDTPLPEDWIDSQGTPKLAQITEVWIIKVYYTSRACFFISSGLFCKRSEELGCFFTSVEETRRGHETSSVFSSTVLWRLYGVVSQLPLLRVIHVAWYRQALPHSLHYNNLLCRSDATDDECTGLLVLRSQQHQRQGQHPASIVQTSQFIRLKLAQAHVNLFWLFSETGSSN